jgi:hypothetical protein
MKCNICGERIRTNCDYKQGRCPHTPPLINLAGLWDKIKKWFN